MEKKGAAYPVGFQFFQLFYAEPIQEQCLKYVMTKREEKDMT